MLLGLAGGLLAVPAVDALRWFSPVRPFPTFCTITALIILVFCTGLVSLCFGILSPRRRVLTVMLALLLVFGLYLVTSFCSASMALASAHGRGTATLAQARRLVLDILVIGKDNSAKTWDLWGGQYHARKLADKTLLVWSDGPDRQNDNAQNQIARKLFAFEKTFDPCFAEPYSSWQEFLRRIALWEVTHVWGQFDGDIVCGATENGGVFITARGRLSSLYLMPFRSTRRWWLNALAIKV